jgi:hypothetical protein
MDRPYTQEQVFAVEQNTVMIAARMSDRRYLPWESLNIDEEQLEAILYDACIALREQMIEEDDD